MKLLLWLFILPLAGCFVENRQENSHNVEIETQRGIVEGKQTNIVIKRESQATSDTKAKSGVDPEALTDTFNATVSAMKGDIVGSVEKLISASMAKQIPPSTTTSDLIAAGTSALTVALGGAALHRNASAKRKERELADLREQHVEVCKQLPPKRV